MKKTKNNTGQAHLVTWHRDAYRKMLSDNVLVGQFLIAFVGMTLIGQGILPIWMKDAFWIVYGLFCLRVGRWEAETAIEHNRMRI